MRVAMIGLGQMGGPMADHVLSAGLDLAVHDIAADALAPRVAAGARAATSPADAAAGCQVVGIVVFDDQQTEAVVAGPDGVLDALAPGSVVCVHATVSLATVEALAEQAAAKGVTLVDAGISGGERGAIDGTLLTMVGGPHEAVETARPYLDAFSRNVLHTGPLGSGMALKLARNGAAFAVMAAIHEAWHLASAAGVDLAMVREALTTTGVFEQGLVPLGFGPPGLLPDDAPEPMRAALRFGVDVAAKDLHQARDLAARHGFDLPVLAATEAEFDAVMRLGS